MVPSPSYEAHTIENSKLRVRILNLGATITHLVVKDNTAFATVAGADKDVVLGFDRDEDYLENPLNPYFGAVVGRVCNRIRDGSFTLEGETYDLDKNSRDGKCTLHGGKKGFSRSFWSFDAVSNESVTLSLTSPDGDDGYPGEVKVIVKYSLQQNKLLIEYAAQVEGKATIINLTNHSYFNLSGGEGNIESHIMTIPRGEFEGVLEKDGSLVPTGKIEWGDQFDFSNPKTIGADIQTAGGYDHCFVRQILPGDQFDANNLKRLAYVFCPDSGIGMECCSTEPSFQFYTGEYLTNQLTGKQSTQGSFPLCKRAGFCIEAGRVPDAINHPQWVDQVILHPGSRYEQRTSYAFDHRPVG